METANVGVGKGKTVAMEGGKGNTFVLAKNNNPYARLFGVKCYKCGEVGHRSNECPKQKAINVVEKDDDVVENEVCRPNGMIIMRNMSKKNTLVGEEARVISEVR